MAIDINRYVSITSGVGAATSVRTRDLIGRLFTNNVLMPTQSPPLEFTSLVSVGNYFGTTSEEYKRAVFYFGFVNKNITQAQKISYARYVTADVAPTIYGAVKAQTPAAWQSIANGSFNMTIGADVNTFVGLDFTGITTLADVATVIQTAVHTKTGVQWTSATVTWDPANSRFVFVGGSAVAAAISVTAGTTGTDIASLLGWLTGAILSSGALEETPVDAVSRSAVVSNNFGSFLFIPALSITQQVSVAAWNNTQNFLYLYLVPMLASDAETNAPQLATYAGTAVTLIPTTVNDYMEMMPMAIEASTNYLARNSVQNYMFQQIAGGIPTVTDDTTANTMDALRVNYYGRTQEAGQLVDFYQRGLLMGTGTAATDMNVYANEQWLKDALTAALMTLLLALSKLSANAQGRAQILGTLQEIINIALFNGTISVNKTLTQLQKIYITEITGDENAWYQVQAIGYWVDCVILPITTQSGAIEYRAQYTLVYSKDDDIRKIEGRDILI